MSEQEKLERGKRRTKRLMITITVAFLVLMLVIPLASVIASSLKEGIGFYLESISTEYVRSALGVTILATVIAVIVNTFFGICAAWLLTKFSFQGKQVLATLIDIPFSISPVIVGLAYLMTFGLPKVRFHDLRHTFATMALQNGVDVKTVSSMLGHYSAGFTLDTYAHVTTDAQLKAAQTMGNILSRAV